MARARNIHDVKAMDRDTRLLHLERFWNQGSPSGFHASVRNGFRPQDPSPHHMLPVDAVHYSLSTGSGQLPDYLHLPELLAGDHHPSVPHPAIPAAINLEEKAIKRIGSLVGVPTASQRTLAILASEDEPTIVGYVKTHYPEVIGRFDRSLKLYQWVHSLEVSRTLLTFRLEWPDGLLVMPESSGTYVEGGANRVGFGTLFRGNPVASDRDWHLELDHWLVPFFSLLGDESAPFDSLALLEEVLHMAGTSLAAGFEKLVAQLLDVYTWMCGFAGLIPEFNAQNVLVASKPGTNGVQICIRDMADMFQDRGIRRIESAPFSRYKAIGPGAGSDLYQRRSFAFDFKMGSYLLEPLCKNYCRLSGLALESTQSLVREVAVQRWSKYPGYFESPNEWWRYPKSDSVGRSSYEPASEPMFR